MLHSIIAPLTLIDFECNKYHCIQLSFLINIQGRLSEKKLLKSYSLIGPRETAHHWLIVLYQTQPASQCGAVVT